MPREKIKVIRLVAVLACAVVWSYGPEASGAPNDAPAIQTKRANRRLGALKAGYAFDHNTIASLAGYSIDGDDEELDVDGRSTTGVRRRIGLSNGAQSVRIHIGVTQDPGLSIDAIVAEFASDSQMALQDRFVDGLSVGISVGDQSLVDEDSTSIQVTNEIAFTRANVFVAVQLGSLASVNLLPIAQEIDAAILSLPNVTQVDLNAARPVISAFSADTTNLNPGGQAILTLTASNPGVGALDILFDAPEGDVLKTPLPLRYQAGSKIGPQDLTVVAINQALLFSEASIQFNVTVP